MRSLSDYGLANDGKKLDLDEAEYIELKDLTGQQKVILDVSFYVKEGKNKAIILFNDGTYTVTGAIAIINKLTAVNEMNADSEDKSWDLQVEFKERTSKKSGKSYIDMF